MCGCMKFYHLSTHTHIRSPSDSEYTLHSQDHSTMACVRSECEKWGPLRRIAMVTKATAKWAKTIHVRRITKWSHIYSSHMHMCTSNMHNLYSSIIFNVRRKRSMYYNTVHILYAWDWDAYRATKKRLILQILGNRLLDKRSERLLG